jgi:tryptophan synthase beta subunit
MKVKICGIMHPEDAAQAAREGCDYIGINFSPRSKRCVAPHLGKEIADAARLHGAEPVAIVVDETLEEIRTICEETHIKTIQLHGERSRSFCKQLVEDFTVIYAIHVKQDGSYERIEEERCLYLFDNMQSGSGKTFNWESFSPPAHGRWMLAGGLNPDNVGEAIIKFNPYGVDTASGVEKDLRKSGDLMKQFIQNAKGSLPFGGRYLPEILIAPVEQLAKHWRQLRNDPDFMEELSTILMHYAGRPTPLTEIKNFAKFFNGPRIFLKREDLLHTGAHKINNALGQCLIAKRLGKKRIIAETGAGQHGVATATSCAYLGLDCVVYMGAKDIERQKPNVDRMKLLGAEIVAVNQGSATLKDAINEALRDWSANYESSHYCLGSALGPDPYPDMVRAFQSVISLEMKEQLQQLTGRKPDVLIACIGGGSNAIGFFHHFIQDKEVQLIGVEAGGIGKGHGQHAARFSGGSPGVLHGCYTYLLQDDEGQVQETHSISAGLDYPAVGPDHAAMYQSGRATYVAASDQEALHAFQSLCRLEGIIPALESSHALAHCIKIAPGLAKDQIVVVNLSGRGDKDMAQVSEHLFSKEKSK